MLSKEQVEQNRVRFLKILSEVNIEGADMQGLVEYLDGGDFFNAPASTVYHCNYEGGLCYHSLNVYDNLVKLADIYCPDKYSKDTLIIIGLLHDISKTDYYEIYSINKKIYSDTGSKKDNKGRFDWFAEDGYKVKEVTERFLGGEHGFNSMVLVSRYIPLTFEESLAILHHHCNQGEAIQLKDLSAILNKYPLVTLVHSADFLSCFIVEVKR